MQFLFHRIFYINACQHTEAFLNFSDRDKYLSFRCTSIEKVAMWYTLRQLPLCLAGSPLPDSFWPSIAANLRWHGDPGSGDQTRIYPVLPVMSQMRLYRVGEVLKVVPVQTVPEYVVPRHSRP